MFDAIFFDYFQVNRCIEIICRIIFKTILGLTALVNFELQERMFSTAKVSSKAKLRRKIRK